MKNTFHLKVKGAEIFDYFIAVLLQDVLAYTGRTVTPAQLKAGFTYQKNISNNPKKPRIASVRLTEYSYPQHYAVVYTRENLRRTAVYDVIEEARGSRFIMTGKAGAGGGRQTCVEGDRSCRQGKTTVADDAFADDGRSSADPPHREKAGGGLSEAITVLQNKRAALRVNACRLGGKP